MGRSDVFSSKGNKSAARRTPETTKEPLGVPGGNTAIRPVGIRIHFARMAGHLLAVVGYISSGRRGGSARRKRWRRPIGPVLYAAYSPAEWTVIRPPTAHDR